MRTDLVPSDEPARLAALARLGLIGTPPDPAFDRIVRLASTVLDVPIALITLVDADRSWFKARVGTDLSETSRDGSFCAHTILEPAGEPLVVADTWLDDRFEEHPLVTANPKARFYAGYALRTPDGMPVGTLGVVDRSPRSLSTRDLLSLADLAALAEQLLAHAAGAATSAAAAAALDPVLDAAMAAVPTDVALAARLSTLEVMLAATSDVVIVVDAAGKLTDASPSLERTLGYPGGASPDGTAIALVHPDDRPLARDELKAAVAGSGDAEPFHVRVLTANGSIRNMECLAIDHFDDPAIRGAVVTMRDVSERHMFNQMLKFQSTHDRVTELPNRALLLEHLRPAVARAGRERAQVAVCVLDIDGMRELNQELGHSAGDELLVAVAKRIRSTVRGGDSLARLEGGEFAVLLDPIADADEATRVARRIVDAVSGRHSLRSGVATCRATAGLAISRDGDDPTGILARAEASLLLAKRTDSTAVEVAPDLSSPSAPEPDVEDAWAPSVRAHDF